MAKYKVSYRLEAVIDVPDGVDVGVLNEERKIHHYDLSGALVPLPEFSVDSYSVYMNGKMESYEGWYMVSEQDRHADN